MQQNNLKKEQFQAVTNYIQTTTSCKEQQLLNYFGETTNENCGICSFCISEKIIKKETTLNLQEQITTLLKDSALSSTEILNELQCPPNELLNLIRNLVDHSKIELLPNNKYRLK